MRMYSSDWDDRLPVKSNWCDALGPYVKRLDDAPQSVFQCPSLPTERSGYAYNASLSGLSESAMANPSALVAAFDAKGGWNLAGGAELVDLRHMGKADIAFADGHVQASEDPSRFAWLAGP